MPPGDKDGGTSMDGAGGRPRVLCRTGWVGEWPPGASLRRAGAGSGRLLGIEVAGDRGFDDLLHGLARLDGIALEALAKSGTHSGRKHRDRVDVRLCGRLVGRHACPPPDRSRAPSPRVPALARVWAGGARRPGTESFPGV